MNLHLLGFIFSTIGEILIGASVLRVHNQVDVDKKIDSKVLSEIKNEKKLALGGIILIIIGFLLQLPNLTTNLT